MYTSRNSQQMTPYVQSKLFISPMPFNSKSQSRLRDPFETLTPKNPSKLQPISPYHSLRLPKLTQTTSLQTSRIIKVASNFSLLSPREKLSHNPANPPRKRCPSLLPTTPKRELNKQRSNSTKNLPIYSNSFANNPVCDVSFGCND